MKTQNTTNNTGGTFSGAITPIATMSFVHGSNQVAANEFGYSNEAHSNMFAEEATYWMIVAVACAFQLMLINLLTVI